MSKRTHDGGEKHILVSLGSLANGQVASRKRARKWTADEDTILRDIINQKGARNWRWIAVAFCKKSSLPRTSTQCLHRWEKCLKPGLKKGYWTRAEDEIIRQSMAGNTKEGKRVRWTAIAKKLDGRLGKQVRERWINHLDPQVKHHPWTAEEDLQLRVLHERYGNHWSWIAEVLPGRSENAIKNRYNSMKLPSNKKEAMVEAAATNAANAAAAAVSSVLAASFVTGKRSSLSQSQPTGYTGRPPWLECAAILLELQQRPSVSPFARSHSNHAVSSVAASAAAAAKKTNSNLDEMHLIWAEGLLDRVDASKDGNATA